MADSRKLRFSTPPILNIFLRKFQGLVGGVENFSFLELAIFASNLFKSVTVYGIPRMRQNFDDCPNFQKNRGGIEWYETHCTSFSQENFLFLFLSFQKLKGMDANGLCDSYCRVSLVSSAYNVNVISFTILHSGQSVFWSCTSTNFTIFFLPSWQNNLSKCSLV